VVAFCNFSLNRKTLSYLFVSGFGTIPAFSGNGAANVNNPDKIKVPFDGPLPPGEYHILDRKSGGLFGGVRENLSDWWNSRTTSHSDWFALYRIDDSFDDETFIEGVRRGEFRLHPGHISKGCITVPDESHFTLLAAYLRKSQALIGNARTVLRATVA
jgi:hypothetical protein